tara:strand:- start:48 stop:1553 length:1506 start_codon:yes stop_codon:yes gene_type:complete
MKNNFKKILNELSYRVSSGVPDLTNEQHLMKLWDILKEHNWNIDARVELLRNLTEQEQKPHKDSDIIKLLGGSMLSVEIINDIINGKYTEKPLSSTGSSYNVNKKEYSLKDLQSEISKNKPLTITTAGTVKKVRSQYGERICHLNVSKAKTPNDIYLGRIYTLYKLSKSSGVETKNKLAPGIGYEKMQIENLTNHMNAMLGGSGHKSLPLYINGKNMGVKIDGAVKVSGSPKADLTLGEGGKPNFFMSYKHGEYLDRSGKELPASYQQYGSLKTFYTKEFNSAFKDSVIGKETDKFLEAVSRDKNFVLFKGMTDISVDNGFIVIHQGSKKTKTEYTQKMQLFKPTRFKRIKSVLSQKRRIDAYFMNTSGWGVRRDLSKSPAGKDISLLSIFGKDYESGKSGINNCDLLMQDNVAFTVSMMTDEEGTAQGVNLQTSSQGHIMFNPKIYGGGKFPTFANLYKPYLVSRYTGEMDIGWSGGKKFIFGARMLIMPFSQAKNYKDI